MKSDVKPSFCQRKNEPFIEIQTQSVKPSFFKGKTKPSSKYEVKESFIKMRRQRKLCPNTKAKKASSKYEVRCEAFVFQRKNETFVEIRSERKLRQNTKAKKASSKYEVRCETFIFQGKNETFLEI
jgi:hypothetical protein